MKSHSLFRYQSAKHLWRSRAAIVTSMLVLLLIASSALNISSAQREANAGNAITAAAEHPAFADALARRPGWTASAFDAQNTYGVWRVQFWDAAGEDIGYADVVPTTGVVYYAEPHYGATTEQVQAAEITMRDFLVNHPEVQALVDDPAQYPIYVEYDGWNRWWGAYMDIGSDSLYFVVRFEGGGPEALHNPTLINLYFANIPSYQEWHDATSAEAIAVAFSQPEIAAALRGRTDWNAIAEPVDGYDGDVWTVYFRVGEETVAQATVKPHSDLIIDFFVW